MRYRCVAFLTALLLMRLYNSTVLAADPGVTLIGIGSIPGNALDLSGLQGQDICARDGGSPCIDRATLGGLGSGITYTGFDNVYLAVPDRGPFDGRTFGGVQYLDRFHFLYMKVNPSAAFPNITTLLLDTRFLKNKRAMNFVGDAYAFDTDHPLDTLRLDPEGVRLSGDGTFFVSDEYGPYIYEFGPLGRLQRRLEVPDKFLLLDPPIGNPTGDLDSAGNSFELYPTFNVTGRQANRGMEGLAITPNGRYLVGIMQNALIQDNGLNTSSPPGRVGRNNRILKIDLQTGKRREYVYVVDDIVQGRGVNEMIAVNNHEFLVLERDNRTFLASPSTDPRLKKIYKIDLDESGLTDVSGVTSLPELPVNPLNIKPVTKSPFIDMLDAAYKVDAATPTPHTIKDVIAEKMEGLAWGPDLPDGRHVLFVMSDNDLNTTLATQIYAFAIDPAKVDYTPQQLKQPLFPSNQVKKAVK